MTTTDHSPSSQPAPEPSASAGPSCAESHGSLDGRDGPEAAATEIVMNLVGFPSLSAHEWVTAVIRRHLKKRGMSNQTATSVIRSLEKERAGERCVERLVRRLDMLEHRIDAIEGKRGYRCATCGVDRPANWFIYEIERDGQWLRPCCAMCARQEKSRGPFPPNKRLANCEAQGSLAASDGSANLRTEGQNARAIIKNCHALLRHKFRRSPLWSMVSQITGHGSGYSHEICKSANLNPSQECGRNTLEDDSPNDQAHPTAAKASVDGTKNI